MSTVEKFAVSERLKRRWIGIDITYLAISPLQRRLRVSFGEQLSPYEIIGAPTGAQGAEAPKGAGPHQSRLKTHHPFVPSSDEEGNQGR